MCISDFHCYVNYSIFKCFTFCSHVSPVFIHIQWVWLIFELIICSRAQRFDYITMYRGDFVFSNLSFRFVCVSLAFRSRLVYVWFAFASFVLFCFVSFRFETKDEKTETSQSQLIGHFVYLVPGPGAYSDREPVGFVVTSQAAILIRLCLFRTLTSQSLII